MTTMTAKEARENFSELINKVAYSKENIIITRNGKKVVVMVPMELLELIEEMKKTPTIDKS